MMKVQVQSRKLVKPCTPTPSHLRTYNISMIDELNPSVHHLRILYYPPSDHARKPIIDALEESLARVLTLFYPLAGRYIKDKHLVDCNDEGAEFSVAHVDSDLLPLIGASADHLNHLLPLEVCAVDDPADPMLAVQVNRFTCGGLAIAVCASQRIFDSCSVAIFLNAWANAASGNREPAIQPDFNSASFFPTANLDPLDFGVSRTRDTSIVCKRFVFNKNAISRLRDRASPGWRLDTPPSRVVVVSAVLTQAILRGDRAKHGESRASLIAQAVNVRERTVPPVSKHACGTWASLSYVENTAKQSRALETDFQGMVMKMREATMQGIKDCARILSDKDFGRWVLVDSYFQGAKKAESPDYKVIWITDWSKFGDYELDFGFGTPVWVSLADIPLHDTVVLMNTRDNNGIEAWVYLHESDTPFLEQDEDIKILTDNVPKPHGIVFPYPCQGHITPTVNLALNLASKGFRITYIQLEFIHHTVASDLFAEEARKTGLDIRYVTISDGFSLEFDRDVNFNEYWETMILDFPNRIDELVGKIISESSDDTFFLVADSMYTWPATIAMKHKLVNVAFSTESALVFAICYHLDLLRENGHLPYKGDGHDVDHINYIPGVESISTKDLMSFIQDPDATPALIKVAVKAFEQVKNADFILCNTVQELETETLSVLNQNQPTYAIGPVTNSLNGSCPESDCTDWLRSKPRGSVLYISLGNIALINKHEIKEIAHGLALSQVQFVWALRTNDDDVFPVGFKDIVKERGRLVVNPLCDHNAILSDQAVGGFLTHCGWNSILESISNGVPMICYPFFADQTTNRKAVVDDWKIGVSLCDDGKQVIDREGVASKIDGLMKGKATCIDQLREEMKKVSKIVRNASESDHGSSRRNFDQFVHRLKSRLDASEKFEGGFKKNYS